MGETDYKEGSQEVDKIILVEMSYTVEIFRGCGGKKGRGCGVPDLDKKGQEGLL